MLAWPDSGMDVRGGTSGAGPKPDTKDDDVMDQDDGPMEGKEGKTSRLDLGALERDLLKYQFSEDKDDEEVDEPLWLMIPSSFWSPTKEASASLSPADPVALALSSRSKQVHKLLHESPRRRRIEVTMRVSFLGTLPEKEWENYQSELECKIGVAWNRLAFMERTWDVMRGYGTHSVLKVRLNQPIMREFLEKLMNSTEPDDLTESVTEDSADDY